jgi:hypothetical protein
MTFMSQGLIHFCLFMYEDNHMINTIVLASNSKIKKNYIFHMSQCQNHLIWPSFRSCPTGCYVQV